MRSLIRLLKRLTFLIVVIILVVVLTRILINCFYDEPLIQSQKIVFLDQSESDSGNATKTLNNESEIRPMKYILQWTSSRNVPFVFMGEGQKGFIERNCPYTNCYVTGNKQYLDDITKFDVVAFSAAEVRRLSQNSLPKKRSPHQKYVFASIESSDYYPVCSNKYDAYFNWTWTFRLDSEVRWGYFNIWDKNGNVVGPNKIMHWIKLEDMEPVSDKFKEQLRTKTKAAAWFVSNCVSRSKREKFTKDLQSELQKYNLVVDIYGKCGPLKCDRSKEKDCNQMLKEQYYFYLSFENSFSEDYVTEKLLNAVENDAVPIVFGAANYTRFLPPGTYLDARELGVVALAARMNELINDFEEYANMFRWKNHYTYLRKFESVHTNEYCLFCTILNDEKKVKEKSIYQNFREWWDPKGSC